METNVHLDVDLEMDIDIDVDKGVDIGIDVCKINTTTCMFMGLCVHAHINRYVNPSHSHGLQGLSIQSRRLIMLWG